MHCVCEKSDRENSSIPAGYVYKLLCLYSILQRKTCSSCTPSLLTFIKLLLFIITFIKLPLSFYYSKFRVPVPVVCKKSCNIQTRHYAHSNSCTSFNAHSNSCISFVVRPFTTWIPTHPSPTASLGCRSACAFLTHQVTEPVNMQLWWAFVFLQKQM